MTSAFKLHDTVLEVSSEAKALLPKKIVIKSEVKLLSELILCILSSQEKYEAALSMMKVLQKNNAFQVPKSKSQLKEIRTKISDLLAMPLKFRYKGKIHFRRLRFFRKKGQYILSTIEDIYLSDLTIKEILRAQSCIYETRENIISHSSGLGPKQASMFLRNVGYYADFAVLDKHVITYMRLMGLTQIQTNTFTNLKQYEKLELELKSYAETYKVRLWHLDLAIWTTMRTLNIYNA